MSCFGATAISSKPGFWRGDDALCPEKACHIGPDGESCAVKECFAVGQTSEEEQVACEAGMGHCRVKAILHDCPRSGCKSNNTCSQGRTGQVCGLCEAPDYRATVSRATCVRCSSDEGEASKAGGYVLLAVLLVIALLA
eukprot:3242596-Rhodomonas_salina.1